MNLLYLLVLTIWIPIKKTTSECKVGVNTNVIVPICPSNEDFEVFKIKTTCALTYSKTTIYNRWGNIVFEEINSNNGFKGEKLSDGTYYYSINYQLEEQTDTLQIEGYLTIQ